MGQGRPPGVYPPPQEGTSCDHFQERFLETCEEKELYCENDGDDGDGDDDSDGDDDVERERS